MSEYKDNIVAYFFGDWTSSKATTANGTVTSFAVDCNHVRPGLTALNFTITGSNEGNIVFSASPDGVNGYVVTDTKPYTGNISINLADAVNGSTPYMKVAVIDTSGIAGTVNAVMFGQTG